MIEQNDIDRLLTTDEAAQLVGMSPVTLQDYRWRGGGPRFIALARNVTRYRRNDLLEWIEGRAVKSTSEAKLRGLQKRAVDGARP